MKKYMKRMNGHIDIVKRISG